MAFFQEHSLLSVLQMGALQQVAISFIDNSIDGLIAEKENKDKLQSHVAVSCSTFIRQW